MALPGARQKIHEAVSNWPGVTAHPHRFGPDFPLILFK
jgi:hypothetical protein